MINDQLIEVEERIKAACQRAGRDRREVTLIAVSKTKPTSMIQEAYDAGIRDFGENKVQEIQEKAPAMAKDIHWHMIGHLQRNKVKQVIEKAVLIHSVDSIRLAEQIEEEAAKKDLQVDILLEVNISREKSKYGFLEEEVLDALLQISHFPHVHVCGFMTIAPFVENSQNNRKVFKKLFQLCVDMKSKNIDNVNMDILSMGMSGDYEVAIEEGATMIRVGTSIFGSR